MATYFGSLNAVAQKLRNKYDEVIVYLQDADIFTSTAIYLTMVKRYVRHMICKPEVVAVLVIILCILFYHQYTKSWWRATYRMRSAILLALGQDPGPDDSGLHSAQQKTASWDTRKGNVGVYAIQGRRQHMEDRYNLVNNFEQTGTSIYGIFDGHGGEFAAEFVEKALFRNIMIRLLKIELLKTVEAKNHIDKKKKAMKEKEKKEQKSTGDISSPSAAEFRPNKIKEDQGASEEEEKHVASDEEEKNGASEEDPEGKQDDDMEKEMDNAGEESRMGDDENGGGERQASSKSDTVDTMASILTEEILSVDRQLLNVARATNLISGTTALVAMLKDNQLTVANVGDSRGVICDHSGFISFNGVWRVAGVLATSRALGDYPLKERNLVIAEPDILTFDLAEIKPQFLILATDGLWDTFTNDEAVEYIKERLDEPHFGAKSITLQAYYRGSLDNVTVMVVNFRHGARKYKEKKE